MNFFVIVVLVAIIVTLSVRQEIRGAEERLHAQMACLVQSAMSGQDLEGCR